MNKYLGEFSEVTVKGEFPKILNRNLNILENGKIWEIIEKMKKKEFSKKRYETPECNIYYIQNESFICTSVHPKVPGTSQEKWEEDEDEDGGELEL